MYVSPICFLRILCMSPRASNSGSSIACKEEDIHLGCSLFSNTCIPKVWKKKLVYHYKNMWSCGEERAPKGYVPMLVGTGNIEERILVSVSVLKHPGMFHLLEMAAQKFGYQNEGVLRIPCDSEQFRRMISNLSRAK